MDLLLPNIFLVIFFILESK